MSPCRGFSLAILLLPAAVAGQLLPVGEEFQVNTFTVGYQSIDYGPRVGASPSGQFVVLWQDYPGYDVSGRLFDTAGAPVGPDFQLRPGGSYKPALAVAPDATFTVVWSMPDADDFGVFAQRFDSSGGALGTEFQVNSYQTGYQGFQQAAVDGNGNFLVAWESHWQDGQRWGVFAQTFDSIGTPLGTEFQVSTYTAAFEGGVSLAGAPAGGFVVAWSSYRYDGVLTRILARRYNSAGTPTGEEFQINTYTLCFHSNPAMSIAPNGDLLAAWSCGRDRDGDEAGMFARRFDSSGTPLVEEFQVNTHTEGYQSEPVVAHDSLGGFLVIWSSDRDTGLDIFGQRYTAEGPPSGDEFRVNTYTPPEQEEPEVALLPGGEFLVAWTSNGQDGDESGVFAQRLRPNGSPVEGKKLIIKNPPAGPAKNKLLLLSKDVSVAAPTSVDEDPRCVPLGSGSLEAGATIRVEGPDGTFSISLPCTGWIADAGRNKFKYRDGTGATCKNVTLTGGRLKIVCQGSQVAYSLGSAQDEISVSISTGNGLKYCTTFGASTSTDVRRDGSNGRVYRAVDAGASSFCY